MPPKGKKTKAEEALDFLSNLDNLDNQPTASPPPSTNTPGTSVPTAEPRASTDSSRPKSTKPTTDLSGSAELNRTSTPAEETPQDEEAAKALAFLEAQINTKRAPLSAPKPTTPRPTTPSTSTTAAVPPPQNETTTPPPTSGWGVSSFWSSATSAIQSAQKMADEQYQKVRNEGVVAGGLEQLVGKGVDLDKIRKGAEERFGGIVKGVDLEKLRVSTTPRPLLLFETDVNWTGQDLLNTTSSTFTSILNTVAPPISAHETLELWLSHPMVGYSGVEGVVYRAWTRILEQTESGELIVVWSPEVQGQDAGDRGIVPVQGWEKGWDRQEKEMDSVKAREDKDPKGRAKQNRQSARSRHSLVQSTDQVVIANVPVTTVPIFLHLQPLLAPLPISEPSILLHTSGTSHPSIPPSSNTTNSTSPNHLYFLMTLHDPTHSLRFTTTSQPSPGDWLDVEYEKSDWVEERLVEVLRTGVEVLAQDVSGTSLLFGSTDYFTSHQISFTRGPYADWCPSSTSPRGWLSNRQRPPDPLHLHLSNPSQRSRKAMTNPAIKLTSR